MQVRQEGRRERAALYREVKASQEREAHEIEQTHRLAAVESAKKIEAKLSSLNVISASDVAAKPCAVFRSAITACYKQNGKENPLACAAEVEAFTECAKQLSRIG